MHIHMYTHIIAALCKGFPLGTSCKEPPANSGNIGDVGSIPGSGRFSGGGHDNPLQYFGVENLMERGTWRSTAHKVAKSQT